MKRLLENKISELETNIKIKIQSTIAQNLLINHNCMNCWHRLYPEQTLVICAFTPDQAGPYEPTHTCAKWMDNANKQTY
jgi:hypothetical protein